MEISVEMYGRGWETALEGVTKNISLKKFHILLHRMAHYIYGTCPTFRIHDITVYQYSLFGCKYLIWRPILEGVTKNITWKNGLISRHVQSVLLMIELFFERFERLHYLYYIDIIVLFKFDTW